MYARLEFQNYLPFTGGLKSYFSSTHTGRSMMRIHDHANNERTVGMGEFIAVMNGRYASNILA